VEAADNVLANQIGRVPKQKAIDQVLAKRQVINVV
jgi:hypothetical protein